MPTQLEFDLVSPFLAVPPAVEALQAKAAALAESSWQTHRAMRLAVRLAHEDLIYGEITDELEQLRVLVGKRAWKRSHKLWERRAVRDPRGVRKVLLAAKSFFNL